MIDTPIGLVLPSTHVYERMDRHRIDESYVEGLLDEANQWNISGNRVVGTVEDHGVVWEIVLEREENPSMIHEWDLITVAPADVDIEEATSNGWSEADALNLALY